jgi:hypothetical protein
MATLELQKSIIDFVYSIDNEAVLKKVFSNIKKTAEKEGWWFDIPVEARNRILQSYEESYNPDNWIDHNEVKKQHAQWLQQ